MLEVSSKVFMLIHREHGGQLKSCSWVSKYIKEDCDQKAQPFSSEEMGLYVGRSIWYYLGSNTPSAFPELYAQ